MSTTTQTLRKYTVTNASAATIGATEAIVWVGLDASGAIVIITAATS